MRGEVDKRNVAWINDSTMLGFHPTESKFGSGQIVAALLLLFFCFLPLHFHPFDESSRISQECSCYLGGQPQLASAPSPGVLLLFTPNLFFIPIKTTETPASVEIQSDFARAPPLA
jgi:hypothetical protein